MDTKLTLSIDKDTKAAAKEYASRQKISLSRLVENYLSSLIKREKKIQVTPLVESLTGVLPEEDTEDIRKEYHEYLNRKYS